MPTYEKLTQAKLKKLQPGESVQEHGLKFERMRGGDGRWLISARCGGSRHHFVVGTPSEGYTRTQAEEVLNTLKSQKREQAHGHAPPSRKSVKVKAAAKDYLEHQEKHGGKDLKNKRLNLRHLVPALGEIPLGRLTWERLQAYRRERESEGASVGTINREMATVSHLITIACKPVSSGRGLGLLQTRPCDVPKESEPEKVERVLSRDEIERLLAAAREDENRMLECFVMLGVHTGLRVGNILSIRIADLHLDQGFIEIPQDKARNKHRPQWITPSLEEYLRGYIKNQLPPGATFLFPSSRSKTGHWVNPAKAWRRAADRAGLGPEVNRHTMRHTFATMHANSGTDAATLQALGGWKTRRMAERYTHAQHMRESMARFDPGRHHRNDNGDDSKPT